MPEDKRRVGRGDGRDGLELGVLAPLRQVKGQREMVAGGWAGRLTGALVPGQSAQALGLWAAVAEGLPSRGDPMVGLLPPQLLAADGGGWAGWCDPLLVGLSAPYVPLAGEEGMGVAASLALLSALPHLWPHFGIDLTAATTDEKTEAQRGRDILRVSHSSVWVWVQTQHCQPLTSKGPVP